jgi:tRNA pseudouridine55 synthase
VSAPPANPESGILLIDKPGGITSHDVVARARKAVGTRKVGHAGTLDPMATGLLILGVNGATRLLTYVVGLDKEYTATIRLGAATTTDDAEGELVPPPAGSREALGALSDQRLGEAVRTFTGELSQRPSSVSAIKVDGRRAYTLAREGAPVELPARPVTVSAFEVVAVRRVAGEWIDVDVRVECSTGTYVRALARDLGEVLGVGGHLTALRRTRIGPFRVKDALGLDEPLAERMLAPAEVAASLYRRLDLTEQEALDLGHGKRIALSGSGARAAIAPDGRLVGLVEAVDGRAVVLANFPAVAQSEERA